VASTTRISAPRSADGQTKRPGQELDTWARDYPALDTHYVATATAGRLTQPLLRQLLPDLAARQPLAYIAGPPGMVEHAARLLVALGQDGADIRTDRFDGY